MSKVVDRVSLRYGRLVVLERHISEVKGRAIWNCKCDCGNSVKVNSSDLVTGNVKSCGCLKYENQLTAKRTHGMTNTGEHHAWVGMKGRCYNENQPAYHNYGGRGIKVCDRWLESFENFYEDMGPKPSSQHSIDRINNNSNYEPGNCRWATQKEQMRNVRYNRLVTVDGMTKTVAEMADYFGIKLDVVWCRLNRDWPIDEVFKAPLTPINKFVTIDGITKNVTDMALLHNIDRGLINNRLKRGWTPDQAFKTKPGEKRV